MSGDIWLYNPDVCDGHHCPKDCDRCSYADECLELMEEEDDANTDRYAGDDPYVP